MLLCREDTVTLYHGITAGGKIQHPVKDVMIVEAEKDDVSFSAQLRHLVPGEAASIPSSTTRSLSATMKGSMLVPFTGIVTLFPSRSRSITLAKKASLLTIIISHF